MTDLLGKLVARYLEKKSKKRVRLEPGQNSSEKQRDGRALVLLRHSSRSSS